MSIPIFYQMRELMVPVWQEDEYQKDIQVWAGISGPVSPNRTKEESVVDIVIVLKNHMRSGFEPAAADLDESELGSFTCCS